MWYCLCVCCNQWIATTHRESHTTHYSITGGLLFNKRVFDFFLIEMPIFISPSRVWSRCVVVVVDRLHRNFLSLDAIENGRTKIEQWSAAVWCSHNEFGNRSILSSSKNSANIARPRERVCVQAKASNSAGYRKCQIHFRFQQQCKWWRFVTRSLDATVSAHRVRIIESRAD